MYYNLFGGILVEKLISIIVPIYKVEKYLNRCIDSILSQSYRNLEIILVDDGSPDNCSIICEEYAKKDKRIKVIHKKNGGLSEARNYGIEASTGDYIMFVDSDDYISKDMCKTLLINALENNADIVVCNFKEVYTDNIEKINKQCIKGNLEVVSNIEALYKYLVRSTTDMVVVWNKLYKRNIFFGEKYIRFPVGKLHEDMYTTYKLYYYANKIVIINDVLYYYFRRKESITGSISEKNLLDEIDAIIEQYSFFKGKETDLKYMVEIKSINMYIHFLKLQFILLLNKKILNKKILNKKMSNLKKCILIDRKNIFKNPYMSWKKYLKYLLIYFNTERIFNKL